MPACPSRFRAIVVLLAAAIPIAPFAAYAQDASSAAAAEALFREGRQLMDQERYGEACPKFQASYELDVALGTLLNLANCYQLDGRLASAWARFIEAETMARRAGDPRGSVARDRATQLEPRLVRVRLLVRTPIDGLRIEISGRELTRATWGSAIPVDPGEITLVASAPGHDPYSTSIRVEGEGTTTDIEVPALAPSPFEESEDEQPGARPVRPPDEPAESSAVRPVGFVLGGVGLAAVGVGFGLGANARALWDDADCRVPDGGGTRVCTTAAAQADAEAAKSRASASTGLVIAGGVLLVTGVVMAIAGGGGEDEPQRASRVLVTPYAHAGGGGLVVGGSF